MLYEQQMTKTYCCVMPGVGWLVSFLLMKSTGKVFSRILMRRHLTQKSNCYPLISVHLLKNKIWKLQSWAIIPLWHRRQGLIICKAILSMCKADILCHVLYTEKELLLSGATGGKNYITFEQTSSATNTKLLVRRFLWQL